MSTGRQIARSAAIVMAAYILSNVIGLIKQVVVLNTFGIGPEMDAYQAAFRLPDLLFNLVAGGALASAFIPTYAGYLAQGEEDRAWRLASAIANLVLIVLISAAILAALFAPTLVRTIIAPGFTNLQQIETTVNLVRVMLISTVIFGVSGLLMGVLNSHQHFLLPALAPSLYQAGIILGATALARPLGIQGLAWGVVAGALAHLLIQIPGLARIGARYMPVLDIHDPGVREVGRLMGPRVVGLVAVQVNFQVTTILASWLAPGSLSALNTAFTIMILPQAAFAQAIAIAAFPMFARQVARGQQSEMRHTLAETLRGVIFLSVPATAGLFILSIPIIRLLFERGAFDAQATREVAWALAMYALGLVGHSLLEILTRAFYALHDTKTPVVFAVLSMTLNVVLSIAFMGLFQTAGLMPHGGLALANSVATALEMLGLLVILRRRLGGLEGRQTTAESVRVGLAAAVMAGLLIMSLGWLENTAARLGTILVIGAGGAIYFLLALLLQVDQVRVVSLVFRRFLPRPATE